VAESGHCLALRHKASVAAVYRKAANASILRVTGTMEAD
jgi:hypothetical protein